MSYLSSRFLSIPLASALFGLGKDGIPGMKAAAMVNRISPDIHIVFVSDDKKYAVDAFEVGAYGYLTCPLDKEKLNKCLMK